MWASRQARARPSSWISRGNFSAPTIACACGPTWRSTGTRHSSRLEESAPPAITTLEPVGADVHYRGFSRLYRKGGRYGPEWPVYGEVSRESPWEPIVGRYTRYGDVLPLVRAPDDM